MVIEQNELHPQKTLFVFLFWLLQDEVPIFPLIITDLGEALTC
jgi:hypothetical protein